MDIRYLAEITFQSLSTRMLYLLEMLPDSQTPYPVKVSTRPKEVQKLVR